MAFEPIVVDASESPLIVTTFPAILTEDAVHHHIEEMVGIAKRGRFALVADVTKLLVRDLDPSVRELFFAQAAAFDAGPGFGKKVSEAIVLDSWLARTLLAAYIWRVQRPEVDLRVMASVTEARAWSLDKLTATQA